MTSIHCVSYAVDQLPCNEYRRCGNIEPSLHDYVLGIPSQCLSETRPSLKFPEHHKTKRTQRPSDAIFKRPGRYHQSISARRPDTLIRGCIHFDVAASVRALRDCTYTYTYIYIEYRTLSYDPHPHLYPSFPLLHPM